MTFTFKKSEIAARICYLGQVYDKAVFQSKCGCLIIMHVDAH